jgi:DNA-directed RNA polymerase subunit RPC12/RpoP
MIWKCAGCGKPIEVIEIAIIGPGTLKWCESCQHKANLKAKELTEKFKTGELTIEQVLEESIDRSLEESKQ